MSTGLHEIGTVCRYWDICIVTPSRHCVDVNLSETMNIIVGHIGRQAGL